MARGSPQDAALSVRPFAGVPPAAVTDLSVSTTSISQQLRLSWTAPSVYPGSTLDSYQIRVGTYSLASVGGSTATWWSGAGTLIQSLYGESPGSNVSRTLGPAGSSHEMSLSLGSTYYVAVRSADDLGLTFGLWSSVVQVVPKYLPLPVTGAPPKKPTAFWAQTQTNGNLNLSWRAVTHDTHNIPVSLSGYRIERYSAIGSTPTIVASVPSGTLSYTTTPNGIYYYRILAEGSDGQLSERTDYIDSSDQNYRYILASDDVNTRLVVPGSLADGLRSESNTYGDDIQIVLRRRSDQEDQTTLKAYDYEAQLASSGQVLPNFNFSQPVNLQVSYGSGSNSILGGAPSELDNPFADATSIAKIASIYWFNGGSYVRLGGTVITTQQAFRVMSRNLGRYAIRVSAAPTQFGLSRGSPYPRVITPNGNENRRVFFFADNPTDADIVGTIYDIRGAKVRSLSVDGNSPTANALVWDGRDENGAVVPSGVYLYEIEAGKESVTGTVAVAR